MHPGLGEDVLAGHGMHSWSLLRGLCARRAQPLGQSLATGAEHRLMWKFSVVPGDGMRRHKLQHNKFHLSVRENLMRQNTGTSCPGGCGVSLSVICSRWPWFELGDLQRALPTLMKARTTSVQCPGSLRSPHLERTEEQRHFKHNFIYSLLFSFRNGGSLFNAEHNCQCAPLLLAWGSHGLTQGKEGLSSAGITIPISGMGLLCWSRRGRVNSHEVGSLSPLGDHLLLL